MPVPFTVPLFVPSTDQVGVLPCAEPGVDIDELFFNPLGAKGSAETALTMCRRCPVSADCRSFARAGKEWGFWGGESETDRGGARRGQPTRRSPRKTALLPSS
ncbi:WhiB family transcriptional regulator [Streptomyces sp. NPDC001594]|uniref:WhiB family transcriptional regulator n=1 Tax=Streptomyces sp. NPDC001594 TaxID=3364590 RepID=UPI00369E6D85